MLTTYLTTYVQKFSQFGIVIFQAPKIYSDLITTIRHRNFRLFGTFNCVLKYSGDSSELS